MASKTDSGEEPVTKKAKVDFLQMIDDKVLTKIMSFGGAKTMVQFQRVNKRCRDLLQDDSPLLKEAMNSLCNPGKDYNLEVDRELHELWEEQEPRVPVTLEYLGLYEACREKHIFDYDAFLSKSSNPVPQAALRMQALFQIMEKFPKAKASWEQFWADRLNDKTLDGGFVRVIVNYLQHNAIMPPVCHGFFDVDEHIRIMTSSSRRYKDNIYCTSSTVEKSRQICIRFLLKWLGTAWIEFLCTFDT